MSDAPRGGRFEPISRRLLALHPRAIDLSLGRLERLLAALDHPERRLPPVIHVAGTNGKGSTCAFLRGCAEAGGLSVHVYTSPHLVRFNERIRIAGRLVDDDSLAETLERVERINAEAQITVFEILTAVAFELFARTPADLCVLEVGLGGRLDATNVIPPPAAGAITSISFDHRDWLGDTLPQIAFEKAGIIKPGMPVATGVQPPEVMQVLQGAADAVGARLLARGRDWHAEPIADGLRYEDADGCLDLPPPALAGPHQVDNAGIALAALRAAALPLAPAALAHGVAHAEWPARLQRLTGRLAKTLPPDWELWLDGGHNEGAGRVLAQHLAGWRDRELHILVGMKQSKDAQGFLHPLLPLASTLWAIAEPGQHLAQPVEEIVAASGGVARPGPTVAQALASLPRTQRPARALICGSLYLAGEVLKVDGA